MEYTLRSGGAVGRASTKGGELISYTPADGREILWQGDPAYWSGQSPLLFPIVGSAEDSKIKIAGREYTMPKHGFARKLEFSLARLGEDFIELAARATSETKACYPFEFTLTAMHEISQTGFSTTYTVDNHSDQSMPVCIGGHPGFFCPMKDGEHFEDYLLEFPCMEDGENSLAPGGYIITDKETFSPLAGGTHLPLRHEYFDERDALILTNLRSRSVKLRHKDTGRGIEFFFPKFDVLGIWTAPGKNAPYLCLEPWSGIPALQGESGHMEDKPYVRILQPGQSLRTGYSVGLCG